MRMLDQMPPNLSSAETVEQRVDVLLRARFAVMNPWIQDMEKPMNSFDLSELRRSGFSWVIASAGTLGNVGIDDMATAINITLRRCKSIIEVLVLCKDQFNPHGGLQDVD